MIVWIKRIYRSPESIFGVDRRPYIVHFRTLGRLLLKGLILPISKEMQAMLCCPATKKPVRILEEEKLNKVNQLIGQGSIKDVEGNVLDKPLKKALITEDSATIYNIDDGIPVMLIESGIPTSQIKDF